MVKGSRLCFFVGVFLMVINYWPKTFGMEIFAKNLIYNNNGLGQYSFEFETSDGTFRKEDGGYFLNSIGLNHYAVRGEYRYKDPKGQHHSMKYIANDKGFQPLNSDDYRFNDRRIVNEDVELRRIFPSEFPQDTVRKSGGFDPEHLGRYGELKNYFKHPKSNLNSHFEELLCSEEDGKKVCRIDVDRYSPDEDRYYLSPGTESHTDRRRIFCLMLLCFTDDELDRVVASFDSP